MTDQASAVDWGPAIPVNGKRPEWLGDAETLQYNHQIEADGHFSSSIARYWRWADDDWDCVVAIRLPASHPYYARQPEQLAESAKNAPPPIPPEVVERMVAFVRACDHISLPTDGWQFTEARAIVALLPEPVDPDLVEARELAAVASEKLSHPWAPKIRAGEKDDAPQAGVSLALAAIRRGRALAAAEREGEA